MHKPRIPRAVTAPEQWVWRGRSLQRWSTILTLMTAEATMCCLLIWSLIRDPFSAPTMMFSLLAANAFGVLLGKSFSVAAVATESNLLIRGLIRSREYAWRDIVGFSLSGPQRRAVAVTLRTGRRFRLPSMLQPRRTRELEELRDRFEQFRLSDSVED